jgi:LmbE family N-acetylglucosaminyl deacetylase
MEGSSEIVIEKAASGCPHKGKILAAIFPHSDDFSFFASGTIVKLLKEGYTGYLIRTTNDEMDSWSLSVGETVSRIERETRTMADILGMKKVYDFNYKNHYLDHAIIVEIRHRLIALFRFLKVDTIVSFDPWGHYEENPDHYITAMAVEQACWMSGRRLDLPELSDFGLEPHAVKEKYYCARGPQLVNRVVDITPLIEAKLKAVAANRTPLENMFNAYRRDGGTIASVEEFLRARIVDKAKDKHPGIEYAEEFHYIGPGL